MSVLEGGGIGRKYQSPWISHFSTDLDRHQHDPEYCEGVDTDPAQEISLMQCELL